MKRFLILLVICALATWFLIVQAEAAFAETYQVTATWEAPTTNSDGSPLTDLSGYMFYYGTQSRVYTQTLNVGNVTTVTVNITATPGTDGFLAVSAFDIGGNDSGYSEEVVHPFGLPVDLPPSIPSGLTVRSELQ